LHGLAGRNTQFRNSKHILHTQNHVRLLAKHLRTHPKFRDQLDDESIDMLYKTAPLHDICKVGVPDRILLKPGKLEPMKMHAQYGHDALLRAEQELGTTDFLQMAREIAYTHHEKWNGSGYPRGLKGDEIPISGRLMALADVYDALISRRIYKAAFPHQEALDYIVNESGKHFDPDVVAAFIALQDEFQRVALQYAD
jgi:putative two-component system response regulator